MQTDPYATRTLAIDPGPEQSAWLVYDGQRPTEFGISPNAELLRALRDRTIVRDQLVIEGVQCLGMPVGAETFDTCMWIGRFIEASCDDCSLVYRKDVKLTLCHSCRAKDPMIRQALLDKFGPGKEKAIGKKHSPGPLYGIASHLWSALAVAVVFCEAREVARKVA